MARIFSRQDDDRDFIGRRIFPNLAKEREPVQPWHHTVGNDHIRPSVVNFCEPVDAISCGDDVVVVFENSLQKANRGRAVVNNQEPGQAAA